MTPPTGVETRAAAAAQVYVDDLDALVLSEADRHHLVTVRRLRDGEAVVASDGLGSWRMCRLVDRQIQPDGVIEHEAVPEHPYGVALSPVKGERTEWAVAKLTELGCSRIIALRAERAQVRWTSGAAQKVLERWARITREAGCQSRRVRLPTVEGPLTLSALQRAGGVSIGVLGAAPVGDATQIIAVGPEGGWSDDERALGCDEVALAGHVLRAETAAVAAGVLLGVRGGGTVATMGLNGAVMTSDEGSR